MTLTPSITYAQNGSAANQWDDTACNPDEDIMLNTNIPFVGRCIKKTATSWWSTTTLGNAFPNLMWWLVRIVMSAVVVVWLLAVLVWWFMVAAEWAAGTKQKWLDLIKLAVWWLILVWLSWIILNLINPNFFTTTPSASSANSSWWDVIIPEWWPDMVWWEESDNWWAWTIS